MAADAITYDGILWSYDSDNDIYTSDQDPTRYLDSNGNVYDMQTDKYLDNAFSNDTTGGGFWSSIGGSALDWLKDPNTVKGLLNQYVLHPNQGSNPQPNTGGGSPNSPSANPPKTKSNTMTYVIIGLVVVGMGTAIYFSTKKK